MDCSRAIVLVKQSAITPSLTALDLPDSIYNRDISCLQWWKHSNLHGGQHSTSLKGVVSVALAISISVIQGPLIGPTEFMAGTSDPQPVQVLSLIYLLAYLKQSVTKYLHCSGRFFKQPWIHSFIHTFRKGFSALSSQLLRSAPTLARTKRNGSTRTLPAEREDRLPRAAIMAYRVLLARQLQGQVGIIR